MHGNGTLANDRPAVATSIAAALLLATFVLPAVFVARKSVTSDELPHVAAGYTYLRTGQIILNPMHPPLIKEISALPLLALDLRMPPEAEHLERQKAYLGYQWQFGERFFFAQESDRFLFWARLPVLLLSLGLAALVARWAGELWGWRAGLLALFLYAFDPTITAHAPLVTTDVGLAFFGTLFLYALRAHLRTPTAGRLAAAGIALGLALGAKFSGVFLLPIAFVLTAAALASRETKGERRSRWVLLADVGVSAAARTVLLVAIACPVVWAIYFFPPNPFFYLEGLATVNADHDPRALRLLMGELRQGTWPHYLLIVALIKTPIPALLLFMAAIALSLRGRRAGWLDEAFLIVPAAGFFLAASLLGDSIGVRYLIPSLPFVFIFTSRVAASLHDRGLAPKAAVGLLLVWQAIAYFRIAPDHLSYFNEIAGGARGGVYWVDDSNVDWGQGLIQLRDYLDENGIEDFHFAYFGSIDPRFYGIRGRRIDPDILTRPPPPGILVVSAHWVARAYAWMAERHGTGTKNWIAGTKPIAVVGNAYHVYDIRR